MELEGTLSASTLPELLQFLSTGKKTGILRLKSGEREVSLMINEGKIINSSSMHRSRKLGEMLINRGFIPRSELDKLLHEQTSDSDEKLLGELLIDNNLVPPDIVKETFRLQLEEEIWELLGWKEGSFNFSYGKDKHFNNILVEIDMEPFLLEGTRRLDEWNKITKNIKNDEVVVTVNTTQVEEFEREIITLSESEWRVLSLINGFYNVGSIILRSGLSKFETFRILNSFLVAGLVRIKDKEELFPEKNEEQSRGGDDFSENDVIISGKQIRQSPKKKTFKFPFRRTTDQDRQVERMKFISPIGVICHFINTFFESLENEAGYSGLPLQPHLLRVHWYETLMRHPRADIIKIRNRKLDAMDLDFFIETTGINSPVVFNCYEESLSALKELSISLIRDVRLQIGEKQAEKIITGISEDMERGTAIRFPDRFNLREFANQLIA